MFISPSAFGGLVDDFAYIEKHSKFVRRPLTLGEKFKYFVSGTYYKKFVPPEPIPGKKTLILDLDDTLIHASYDKPARGVQYFLIKQDIYVWIRPGLKEFLDFCNKKFDLFIFTASPQDYADQIINKIAPFITFDHRLYRDSCYPDHGFLRKDITILKRKPEDVILVDDNLNVYLANRENSLPIDAWKGAPNDKVLNSIVIPVLKKCLRKKDVRNVLLHSRCMRRHSYAIPFF